MPADVEGRIGTLRLVYRLVFLCLDQNDLDQNDVTELDPTWEMV